LWAYEVLSDDLLSGPGWLDSERYTIVAKFPPGTSQAQLHAMLQNLLVERFGLTLHRESRIQTAYDLTIGKNGSKLRPSSLDVKAPPEYEPDSPPLRFTNDGASFPQPPAGRKAMFFNSNGPIIRWTGQMQSLTDLASFLALRLGHQVTDKTGLTGVYDFQLAYSKPPTMTANGAIDNAPTGGLNLERAVQEQLGLHLELAKGPVTYVVIDHIDREPRPKLERQGSLDAWLLASDAGGSLARGAQLSAGFLQTPISDELRNARSGPPAGQGSLRILLAPPRA
jgi:uncharacterized protein (TIGR03435 family)